MGAPGPAPCSYSSCGTSDCVILVVLECPRAEAWRAVDHHEGLERKSEEVANAGISISRWRWSGGRVKNTNYDASTAETRHVVTWQYTQLVLRADIRATTPVVFKYASELIASLLVLKTQFQLSTPLHEPLWRVVVSLLSNLLHHNSIQRLPFVSIPSRYSILFAHSSFVVSSRENSWRPAPSRVRYTM